MIIYAALMVVIPFAVTGPIGAAGEAGYWKGVEAGMGGTEKIGGAIITTIRGICELIQMKYEMLLEEVKMRMNIIQMNMCMLTYQRLIDNGQCMETSCFTNLIECVDFGVIDSSMDALDSLLDDTQNTLDDVMGDWGEVTDFFVDLDEEDEKEYTLEFKCQVDGKFKYIDECCDSSGGADGYCLEAKIHAKVQNLDEDCKDPYIFVVETEQEFKANENHLITHKFGDATEAEVDLNLKLYCEDDVIGHDNEVIYKTFPLTYYKSNEDCICLQVQDKEEEYLKKKGEVTAPTISGITIDNDLTNGDVTDNSVTISWKTNVKATGCLLIRKDSESFDESECAFENSDKDNSLTHTKTKPVESGTKYHYKVVSYTDADHKSVRGDYTFETIAEETTQPPPEGPTTVKYKVSSAPLPMRETPEYPEGIEVCTLLQNEEFEHTGGTSTGDGCSDSEWLEGKGVTGDCANKEGWVCKKSVSLIE